MCELHLLQHNTQTETDCGTLRFVVFQLKVPAEGSENEFVNFRKLLLNRCQREFEKDKSDELKWEKWLEDIEALQDVSVLI